MSPTQMPLVTVITPTYNRAAYIEETIDSVLAQDYPNLQYIVLDDGSKDDTIPRLEKYGSRITWHSHANMGEARTVNRGFDLATGEYVGVINSDDPLLPGAISAIIGALQANPQAIVAYPDWTYIDAVGTRTGTVKTLDYSYERMVGEHRCLPGPGAFFTTQIARTLNGRDASFRYVGDYDFWLRAGLYGPFVRVPQVLATFRVHPESVSVNSKGIEMAREDLRLLDNLFANPKFPSKLHAIKNMAYANAYIHAARVCGSRDFSQCMKYYARSFLTSPTAYCNSLIRGKIGIDTLRSLRRIVLRRAS